MAATVIQIEERPPRPPPTPPPLRPPPTFSELELLWLTKQKPIGEDPKKACIYRAPMTLRRVNHDAFTPQTVLIGPLQLTLRNEAIESAKETWSPILDQKERSRYMMYLQMEEHKKTYLTAIKDRCGEGWEIKSREYIEEHEKQIKTCYAEPMKAMKTEKFVKMILCDAAFIIELFFRSYVKGFAPNYFNDDMAVNSLRDAIYDDLVLLENQLPYFLLEELYELMVRDARPTKRMPITTTFRELTLKFFEIENHSSRKSLEGLKFEHFTDLLRLARIGRPGLHGENVDKKHLLKQTSWGQDTELSMSIRQLYNAEKLQMSGVDFVVAKEEKGLSTVEFKEKKLHIGSFVADSSTEVTLRNIMALEHSHYRQEMYVTSYVQFLALLIDSDKDAELLANKGIIKSNVGFHDSLVKMVKTLSYGLVLESSYSDIVQDLKRHHSSFWNRSVGTLKGVYFDTLWSGTATVAGVILLVLSVTQTVTSILQLN